MSDLCLIAALVNAFIRAGVAAALENDLEEFNVYITHPKGAKMPT